jgi:Arc/MetJ family transcription regulator
MPINVRVNEQLIAEAMRAGNHRTKIQAVTTALEEYVKMKRRLGLLAMVGQVEYDSDYDYKADRRRGNRRIDSRR